MLAGGPAGLERLLPELVEDARREVDSPGAAVALVVDGGPVVSASAGTRGPDAEQPLEPDARHYAYSVTKTLLAAAVLQLEGEGRLRLADPLRLHLDEIDLPDGVTARRALDHSAGLPDYGGLPEYHADLRADPARPWTDEEFLARTLETRGLSFAPGQGWAYSNVGYLLLRRLVERLDGRSLAASLRERLFAPLGLERTSVVATLEDAAGLTLGWSAAPEPDGALQDVSRRYHPGWVAHGLVATTAPELARLVEGLFDGTLLPSAALARMRETLLVLGSHPLFRETRYGLGLMLDPASRFGEMAGHNGGGPGYSAAAYRFSDVAGHRVSAAALLNRDATDDLAQRLLLAVLDRVAGRSERLSP